MILYTWKMLPSGDVLLISPVHVIGKNFSVNFFTYKKCSLLLVTHMIVEIKIIEGFCSNTKCEPLTKCFSHENFMVMIPGSEKKSPYGSGSEVNMLLLIGHEEKV